MYVSQKSCVLFCVLLFFKGKTQTFGIMMPCNMPKFDKQKIILITTFQYLAGYEFFLWSKKIRESMDFNRRGGGVWPKSKPFSDLKKDFRFQYSF